MKGHLWSDEERHQSNIEAKELWGEYRYNREEENKAADD